VFEEGIGNDPENLVNYSGGLAALSLLGKPARVELLERYPNLQAMPTELVYELALNRAEAGAFAGAKDLFRGRFFGREEGGTNVRQVWVEVKLLEATALAKSGKCDPAVTEADRLGSVVEGLQFTRDGLGTWLGAARTQYFLGEIYSNCGKKELAETKFFAASRAGGVSDLVWARAAAKKLNGFDDAAWMERLNSGIAELEVGARNRNGWPRYVLGILRLATGETQKGREDLRAVFLSADTRLSWHLSRMALENVSQ
jgi:hypothetical protein